MSEETPYIVGYRHPPKHSQFQKGQSGNPKNRRPKKAPSFADLIDKAFARQVTVREGGKAKRTTILELITRKLVDAAAQGNSEAIELLMQLSAYGKKRSDDLECIIRIVASNDRQRPKKSAAETASTGE